MGTESPTQIFPTHFVPSYRIKPTVGCQSDQCLSSFCLSIKDQPCQFFHSDEIIVSPFISNNELTDCQVY